MITTAGSPTLDEESGENPTLAVLLAFDGSEHSVAAIELIENLHRSGLTHINLTALCVLPTQYFESHQVLQAALEKAQARLELEGVKVVTMLKSGNPAPSIIEEANETNADLIVVGAKGLRATLGILLGGVAQQVVEYARQPVLVVRATTSIEPRPATSLKRILVVVDGSESSRKAVEYIAPICEPGREARCAWLPAGAEMVAMHVLPPSMALDEAGRAWTLGPEVLYPAPVPPLDREAIEAEEERHGQALLAEAFSPLLKAGFRVSTFLTRGDAATEILSYIKHNEIDLVVCGSRGLNPFSGWLLGSVSRKLVHYANCSVLIVKQPVM